METNNETQSNSNSHSVLSLVFGILNVLFFCMGAIPLPFTGFICFPLSFVFAVLALIFGVIALNRIRRQNGSGSSMAWVGIISGGFVFMCLICVLVAFASLFIFAPNHVPMPPFPDIRQF